jgi:hypothetical protein
LISDHCKQKMRSIREIFKNKEFLLDEPEVEQLLDYALQLEDEIVEFKFEKQNNKQLAMLDMIKEVVKGCNEIQKQQQESIRFGYEAPDFEAAIANLKRYIHERCRDEKIYL